MRLEQNRQDKKGRKACLGDQPAPLIFPVFIIEEPSQKDCRQDDDNNIQHDSAKISLYG